MARVLYILICLAGFGAFVWFAHHMVYGYSRDFGIGFGVGGMAVALLAGAYITLRYGD